MRIILILLIATLLMTTACLVQPVTCPDGSTVMKAENCPAVQEAQEQLDDLQKRVDNLPDAPAAPPGAETGTPAEEESTPHTALAALLEKARTVKNYQFVWAPIKKSSSGQMVTLRQRTYYIRGNKAKVEIPLPRQYDGHTFVPIVYLDYATKTARGWCTLDEIRECSRNGEERKVNFNDYAITLPTAWIDRIPASAALTDGPTFNARPTKRVEYQDGATYYQVLLDSFYGMPVRIGMYSDSAHQILVGGVEYQDAAFNSVTPDIVAFPGQ